MQTLLRIVPFFQVLVCVEMKTGNVFAGTEGDSLDISWNYPDGYQYTPMYFCRHPCSNSDVLIEAQKADEVVSKGRYLALNSVSARSFSVTIKKLTLKDSGVYYCAVDKWGSDKLTKVKITVRNAVTIAATPSTTNRTDLFSVTTVTHSLADPSTSYEETPSTTHSIHSSGMLNNSTTNDEASSSTPSFHSLAQKELSLYGGVLGLLLCCVILALVVFYRRRSNTHTTIALKPPVPVNQISDPPPDLEDFCHVYDEMLAVYSVAGPANTEDSTEAYSVIHYAPPAEEDSCLYSLIAPH